MKATFETWARQQWEQRETTQRRVRGWLREVFTAPFRADPELAVTRTREQRDRIRRAAFLRLLLLCVFALIFFLLLPAALLGGAGGASLVRLVLVLALTGVGLLLVRWRLPYLGAILFIYGTLAIALHFFATNPGGLDLPALLTYTLFSLLILLTGLVLPGWATWLTTAIGVVITIAGVFGTPLAPSLAQASPDPAGVRFAVIGPLVVLQIFVGVFSWVAGRGASASMEAVSRAYEREHELAGLKDQFILAANHELRTPIMTLYGNVELLNRLGERATPEQRSRMLERAMNAGDAVLKLLSSVLDVGNLESREPQLEMARVNLLAALTSVLETFDPRETGEPVLDASSMRQPRSVQLEVPQHLVVIADEVRLRQVLVNLLSNALKYSPPGSPILVSAERVEELDEGRFGRAGARPAQVKITMRDYGFGVPRGDAPKLFNRFVRLERDIGGTIRGTGLGLYLCRTLVEAMGGRIWVESSGVPGEGSAFCFTLVAANSTVPVPEATRARSTGAMVP
jgi:signal transduction histidine kinase